MYSPPLECEPCSWRVFGTCTHLLWNVSLVPGADLVHVLTSSGMGALFLVSTWYMYSPPLECEPCSWCGPGTCTHLLWNGSLVPGEYLVHVLTSSGM